MLGHLFIAEVPVIFSQGRKANSLVIYLCVLTSTAGSSSPAPSCLNPNPQAVQAHAKVSLRGIRGGSTLALALAFCSIRPAPGTAVTLEKMYLLNRFKVKRLA